MRGDWHRLAEKGSGASRSPSPSRGGPYFAQTSRRRQSPNAAATPSSPVDASDEPAVKPLTPTPPPPVVKRDTKQSQKLVKDAKAALAAYEAAQARAELGQLVDLCGLCTQHLFTGDPFLERVTSPGGRLVHDRTGGGLGFGDLIEKLPWRRLI